jgi:ABC-type nitrate/sulfonate/bicarbonate transport system substrate-binding protein
MTHYIALNLCKRMGWDPVQDVSLMAGALVLEVLQNRSVDAIVADDVHGTMASAAGYQPLVDLRTWNLPIAGSVILTTKTWVKENREAARRFMKSTVEAIAMFKNDPKTAYSAMAHWWNVTDPEKQKAIYVQAKEMARKPYPAVDGIKKTMETYDSHEMRRHKPEDFYDASFVRELDESGYIDSLYK